MSIYVELSIAERDAILAGLRLLQRFKSTPRTCVVTDHTGTSSLSAVDSIEAIAADNGEPLNADEIEDLIQEINSL